MFTCARNVQDTNDVYFYVDGGIKVKFEPFNCNVYFKIEKSECVKKISNSSITV